MNSVVELVVNEKTSHIRELISRQKPKKISSKRRSSYNDRSSPFKNNYYSTSYKSHGNNRYDTNVSKYGHNTCTNYNNVRGYDFVKHDSSSLHKPKGFVTSDLQHDVEDLCRKSQVNFIFIKQIFSTMNILVPNLIFNFQMLCLIKKLLKPRKNRLKHIILWLNSAVIFNFTVIFTISFIWLVLEYQCTFIEMLFNRPQRL